MKTFLVMQNPGNFSVCRTASGELSLEDNRKCNLPIAQFDSEEEAKKVCWDFSQQAINMDVIPIEGEDN